MAAKENQGLQAVVITLSILFLLTLVGLFLVNNSRKTAVAQVADLQRQNTTYQEGTAKAQLEANTYKEWIGYDPAALLDSLTPQYEQDQNRFGANMEKESRKYRTMLDNIFEERNKAVQNEASALAQVKDLKDRLLAVEAQKEKQVQEYKKQLDTAKADFASEQNKFNELRTQTLAEKETISKTMKDNQAAFEQAAAKWKAEKDALEVTIGKLENSITKLRAGVPSADQFAQPADGHITNANQLHKTVWIDIGAADGLRPQVTFSVAAAGDADAEAAAKKASIEVVRILGPHMAEGLITSDDPKNPVMRGDRIYSQVWDRGRQVGFGIAGFVDLNGDRKSDLQLLKDIISTNNGRVDAAPDDTGKRQGDMKVDTRYLVLGKYPEGTLPGDEALRISWKELGEQAEQLGIETVPVDEFIKLMGWRLENRSVSLGANSRAEDFPPGPRGQDMPPKPVQPTGVFKKRLPGVSY